MQKSAIGLAILLLCTFCAFSQQTQRRTALREIIPGHYVFSSGTFNSGLIVTSEGVVVLDALDSENAGKAERQAIANTIRQPVRFLVSSTFHNNYSKGNVAYADVWKIGHENYRTDLLQLMQREQVPAEEQKARLPNETYRDRVTLYLGGKEIQIRYLGRGHTRGDSIIYVPQDRIAYLSELFFAEQFLYIDDGYGLDWLKTLDAVEGLGAEIFVPAHGPIPADPRETRQGLGRFRQMLVDIRDAVQKEIARGATEDQAVATIRWPQYEKEGLGAEIFVPAHGPIPADPRETRQGLGRFRQMLVDIRDAVQKEIARGATEDQAVATIRWPQYEKMQGYSAEREVAVRRLYRQLTGALP